MFNLLKKFPLLTIVILFSACFLLYSYYGNGQKFEQIAPKIASTKPKENSTIKSERNKTKSSERVDDSADNQVNATARVLGIDQDQYQGMKEDYFCDLAITARENCELQIRSEESMEICLKMGGYFTNSRHCGYQP